MSLPLLLRNTLKTKPTHRLLTLTTHLSNPHLHRPSHLHNPTRNMTTPTTMKAIQITRTGGPEVLTHTTIPTPTPQANEAIVQNTHIGINYIDTYFRTGLYPSPLPLTLGREAAGTITSLGSSSSHFGLKVGDRVVYLGTGAYAEYTAVPSEKVYKLPADITSETAAASLLQGLTALTLIREAHHVEAGDWVLVHAAAGGMGLWLCQLLKAVGARVIGTASTAEKRKLAEEAGAEVVLDYPETLGKEVFVDKIKELTGGPGVAVVFDGVGKATFDVDLDIVRLKGSLISFGNASGAVPPFAIARLSPKNIRLMRPQLFGFISTRDEFERYTKELFEIVEREGLKVKVHEIYRMEDVARAHEDLEGRKTTGKLLLSV